MNYPTLQKVLLTAAAVMTSVALNAQAGGLSTARQNHGSSHAITPLHKLLFPDATYMIDDGSAEDAVGFGNGLQNFESLWFNQFDVIPGQTTISSVSVAWGTPAFPDPTINGMPTTVCVWSDPNGDGQPFDAVLLGSVDGTMQNQGTDTFVTYTFNPPVALPPGATSFFVGDLTPMTNDFQRFFQGIDQNSTKRQSWVSARSDGGPVDIVNPGNNDFLGIIDDFGIPGNWLIRADAGGGGGGITLSASTRRQGGKTVVALTWDPADGGSVNVIKNGASLGTTDDDGAAQDNLGSNSGVFIYQVCETDSGDCSNEVRVRVRPHAD